VRVGGQEGAPGAQGVVVDLGHPGRQLTCTCNRCVCM
jgi:hypothetical protein